MYLMYPFLSRAIRKRPTTTLLATLVISIASRIIIGNYVPLDRGIDWFPTCRIFEFTLGIWLITNKRVLNCLSNMQIKKGQNTIIYFSNLSYPIYLTHVTALVFAGKYISAIRHPELFIFAALIGTFILSNIIIYTEKGLFKLKNKKG